MKTRRLSVAAIAALALLPSGAAAQKNSGKTHVRHIFVSVTDAKGAPVEGLSANDFKVSEAGQPREVTRAGPAKDPMRIALILDTSDAAAPALNHMRSGAAAFRMSHWYEVDVETRSDIAAIDVAVARDGVRLQVANTRR